MEEPELRREMFREVKLAGMVPVPVAAMTEGSACWRSHSMVSPSDLWPSSRVSWKTRAAQRAGMRMRRPRPSTLVWRSLVEVRLGGGFLLLLLLEDEGGSAAKAAEEDEVAIWRRELGAVGGSEMGRGEEEEG